MLNSATIYGLVVTYLAWKTVGNHRWLAMLKWPVNRKFRRIIATPQHFKIERLRD